MTTTSGAGTQDNNFRSRVHRTTTSGAACTGQQLPEQMTQDNNFRSRGHKTTTSGAEATGQHLLEKMTQDNNSGEEAT
jgi:hypothetical protein